MKVPFLWKMSASGGQTFSESNDHAHRMTYLLQGEWSACKCFGDHPSEPRYQRYHRRCTKKAQDPNSGKPCQVKDTERDLAFRVRSSWPRHLRHLGGERLSPVENSLDPVSGFDYRVARFHYGMPFDLTSRVGVATGGFGTKCCQRVGDAGGYARRLSSDDSCNGRDPCR
jgi:hypothetical protein